MWMMYRRDYEGVHQGNLGWVVADIRLIPWFGIHVGVAT